MVRLGALAAAALLPVLAAAEPPMAVFLPPTPAELSAIANPALRDELLRLAADDQRARASLGCGGEADAGGPSLAEVDRDNTARLRAIVEEHGWPTVALVGSDGARAAWLLAQHADHDVAWQKRALALMEPHAESGQASPIDLAYLTDRVRVNEGRPQLFGTQFHEVDGKRQPSPIEDPEGVDARRESLGMRTMRAYTKFVNT